MKLGPPCRNVGTRDQIDGARQYFHVAAALIGNDKASDDNFRYPLALKRLGSGNVPEHARLDAR